MDKMKACILKELNNIECMMVDKPCVEPGTVLVQIKACGICSSDLNRVYRTGTYHYPIVLGHEFAGKIVEIGEGVSQEYLNKHVVVFPLLPCNKCEFCKNGYYAQCQNYNYFGSRCDGGMAEYLVVPEWNLNIVDDEVPYEVAALAEPMAVAVHAVKQIPNLKDKGVCIIGTGAIGIMCGIYLRALGARQVYFIVRNTEKRNFLKRLGFDNILDEKKHKQVDVDVVIECVGSNRAIEQAIEMVKPRGSLLLLGNPTEDLHIEHKIYWKILRSEINVKGLWNSHYKNATDDWKEAISFLTDEKDSIKNVITHRFELDDVKRAFEVMNAKTSIAIKGVMINE